MKVLFIDIDTLRPDHMGCYGYSRNTTPNMDVIAKEGVRFNKYYCSDAPCLPSRAALVSGRFGIHNGAVGHGGTCGDMRGSGIKRAFKDPHDKGNFNYVFRNAGMYTTSISSFAERHSSLWFNAGYNETYNVGKSGLESGEEILPIALDWLDRNQNREDWFLHVHFWDPHTPYRAPESFGNPFENEPLETWITEDVLKAHQSVIGPHTANEIIMYTSNENPKFPRQPGAVADMAGLKRLMDGYDCGIRHTDDLVGQIFDKLRAQNIFDDVAIIITSDHGENMGELGIYSEHATADHNTCNIPMLIKWPNAMANYVDDGFHYNLDIAPTMAELLGSPAYASWDGKSYAKTLMSGEDTGYESLVISQMAHVCQRSARFGDWLYMRTYHDGFHMLEKEMLYNIASDPHEQFDVKEQYPEICQKGAKYILDWHDEMMMCSEDVSDPMWTVLKEGGPFHTVNELDSYLVRLEATGRKEGADALRKKHASKL